MQRIALKTLSVRQYLFSSKNEKVGPRAALEYVHTVENPARRATLD